MHGFGMSRILLIFSLFSFSLSGSSLADPEKAWQSLNDLRISEAKAMFQKELKSSPGDFSLMRGLLLVAYYDMDYKTQVQMIRNMVQTDPKNPYLLAVFEHVAANLDGWSDRSDLEKQIGEALVKNCKGSLAYTGKHMLESVDQVTTCKAPDNWVREMGYASGCWVTGPFENSSRIAAYRSVLFEGEPLDTLAKGTGKNGSKAGWTWLQSSEFGDLIPSFCLENTRDAAEQSRIFFELPSDMPVLLLPGSLYHDRILVDGRKVHDDPTLRNAVQREGVSLQLKKGMHEITLVLGADSISAQFRLEVMDTSYQPVKGIKWLRYAKISPAERTEARKIHPIFDPFDEYVNRTGQEPDTRYWKALLRTYNGYSRENVRELEELFDENKLSLLEVWSLYESLLRNGEPERAVEYLKYIRENSSTPLIDLTWIISTMENLESRVNAIEELDKRYPDRFGIEFLKATKPLLNQDIKTHLEQVEKLKEKYPEATTISLYLSIIYQSIVRDPESSLREFNQYCEMSRNRRLKLIQSSSYFTQTKNFDKAIESATKVVKTFPYDDLGISQLFEVCYQSGRTESLLPMLDTLKIRFPYNIELYSMLYDAYSSKGEFDKAQDILKQIHELKPSAVQPYISLDYLHNNITYDSIFGSVDASSLWDVQPSEGELAGKNYWFLLDREQKVIFESGMVLKDVHWAIVLLDQKGVEEVQETALGFDPKERFRTLLVAQRLRKGQPPLAGTVSGENVIFKDLKPGDAVEIHYRVWESGAGDLWKEFWDTYVIPRNSYQRYWEYAILTNRADLKFVSEPPASSPETGTRCGFKRISWHGEKQPGLNFDLVMLPPEDDLIGKVFTSTITSWDLLSRWYASISEAILKDNPRADKLSDLLTRAKNTQEEKLQALYEYVVLEVPYQVIRLNYNNATPHKPDEVLINRWGDCKDKTHLLIQMLRRAGIPAWPALVMTREHGSTIPLPQFAFDHLITCCLVNGDTLYIDASDLTSPAKSSLARSVAGQPSIQVSVEGNEKLRKLPRLKPRDDHFDIKMKIYSPKGDVFDFEYEQKLFNLESGDRRDELKGVSPLEVKRDLESDYSKRWGVVLSLDSVRYDSIRSTDSTFNEYWRGKITLNVQTIGKATVISLPHWSTVSKSLLSMLEGENRRDIPLDLRWFSGRSEKTLVFDAPTAYGEPQLPEPVELKDSLFSFVFRSEWDRASRKLLLHYILEAQDAYVKPEIFLPFARKVVETFDAPLLFQKD